MNSIWIVTIFSQLSVFQVALSFFWTFFCIKILFILVSVLSLNLSIMLLWYVVNRRPFKSSYKWFNHSCKFMINDLFIHLYLINDKNVKFRNIIWWLLPNQLYFCMLLLTVTDTLHFKIQGLNELSDLETACGKL